MKEYIVLIVNRYDSYDRHWIRTESEERAKKLRKEYMKDNKFTVEICELGNYIE